MGDVVAVNHNQELSIVANTPHASNDGCNNIDNFRVILDPCMLGNTN